MVVACDAYGTLLDLASVLRKAAPDHGPPMAELPALSRTQQLEYTWLRTLMGHYADFCQVTVDSLDSALARPGLSDPGMRRRLLAAYDTVSPYPEVPALLRALREAGSGVVILSNGTPAMLESAPAHSGGAPGPVVPSRGNQPSTPPLPRPCDYHCTLLRYPPPEPHHDRLGRGG